MEYGDGMRVRHDQSRTNFGFDPSGPIRAFRPAGMSGSISEPEHVGLPPEHVGLPHFDVHLDAGHSVLDSELPHSEEDLSGC